MIDLSDTTFIIPIGIESEDRKQNAIITLSYLCKHLNSNIIIFEYDKLPKVHNIINSINTHTTTIDHIFMPNTSSNDIFHRTRFLNEMLVKVTTPVVVNYDIDILLEPQAYRKCSDFIRKGHDLVYPYFWGDSQYQINYQGRHKVLQSLSLNSLTSSDKNLTRSEYGHCQFFKTSSYLEGGMENEGFISYAPEDQERGYRFKKLGYNVMWSTDYVYHIEHTRGINSSSRNPMMEINNKLFDQIKSFSLDELKEYYKKADYIKKYKKDAQ